MNQSDIIINPSPAKKHATQWALMQLKRKEQVNAEQPVRHIVMYSEPAWNKYNTPSHRLARLIDQNFDN